MLVGLAHPGRLHLDLGIGNHSFRALGHGNSSVRFYLAALACSGYPAPITWFEMVLGGKTQMDRRQHATAECLLQTQSFSLQSVK